MDFLQYDFVQRALIVGIFISIITANIGVIIVLRRLSMIGDALSHNAFGGVAAGLMLGINPILTAILFCIIAAIGIEKIRQSFKKYSEISIAIVTSMGIGLAGIFSGFIKNSVSLNSFLFGSIAAVSDFELYTIVILSIVVFIILLALYKELFYITFDEEAARLSGIPVKIINFIFILFTAITISISTRVVGVLVISSLMVIPIGSAMQIAKSFKETYIYSILFSLVFTITGLIISYYLDLKPGATIVLVGVVTLVLILIKKGVRFKIN